jgi:hypothetical protein
MKKFYPALITCLLFSYGAVAQKMALQLNLVKGNTYYNISRSAATINQTIQGQAMEINMVIAGKTSFTVTGIRDSLYDMQVKYDSLNLQMQLPNGNLNASTEGSAADIFSAILAKLKSKPFLLVMSKTGRVQSVSGLEAIFNEIINGFPNVPAEQKAQASNQMMQSFGEKAFKGSIELYTYIFPAGKVAKNEKWVIDSELQSNISAKVHTVYSLKDVTPQHYIIEGIATIGTDDKNASVKLNDMPVKYNLAGTMNTMIQADRKTGWINEATVKQTIKGNTQIMDNPKLPGGMLIPMTITGTTSISNK